MKFFRLNLICMAAAFFGACSSQQVKEESKDERPNIVVILTDDLGWSDIGAYGSEIATPNLDMLADGGLRFNQFYNTSKCFPSRASMLSGQYAHHVGFGDDYKNPLTNGITFGHALREAGYRTWWSGKHHGIQNPINLGFDHFYGLRDGASNHFNPGLQREGEPKPAQKRMRTWIEDSIQYKPYTFDKDFYTTDAFTDKALEWMDNYKDQEEPFCLYLAYTAPHDPLMAWPEDIAKYKGKYDEGYAEIRKRRFEKQKALGIVNSEIELSEAIHKDWDSLSADEKAMEAQKMEVYAAMVDRVDQNIGRVIEKLKEQGKFENTIIFFMSDNGGNDIIVKMKEEGEGDMGSVGQWTSLGPDWANVSNTPYRLYKNHSYEGGINTPMIVHWPKEIKSGKVIDHSHGHFVDILPTLLDVGQAPYPVNDTILPSDGISLRPLFKAPGSELQREAPLCFQWKDESAVRLGQWKIVRVHQNPWQLYDLNNDPYETTDLAEEQAEKVVELAAHYEVWQQRNAEIKASRSAEIHAAK